MQIVTSEGTIIPMDGFEDLASLATNEEFANLIAQFIKEREEQAQQSLWDTAGITVDNNDSSSKDPTTIIITTSDGFGDEDR